MARYVRCSDIIIHLSKALFEQIIDKYGAVILL